MTVGEPTKITLVAHIQRSCMTNIVMTITVNLVLVIHDLIIRNLFFRSYIKNMPSKTP